MATDNLKEVGKALKKTSDNASRAVKKQNPIRPSVERTRDIFDPAIPFTMEFQVSPNQKSISLDLEFNKPPPLSNCLTGTEVDFYCEEFTMDMGPGDHEITLNHRVYPDTVFVFINTQQWSNWGLITEGSYASNAVILVQNLTEAENTVSICYRAKTITYFEGEAFTAWAVAYPHEGSLDIYYTHTGDEPVQGWYITPTVGTQIVRVPGGEQIQVLENMVVRISAAVDTWFVYGNTVAVERMELRCNGAIIGLWEREYATDGLAFGGSNMLIDVRNFEASAGDVFEVYTSLTGTLMSGIGNAAGAVWGTYLRVGRGSFNWTIEQWEGP